MGKTLFIFSLRRSCLLRQGGGIIVQVLPKTAFFYRILEALSAQDLTAVIGHFCPPLKITKVIPHTLTIKRWKPLVNKGIDSSLIQE
jgi:hypothetical protein